MRQNCQNEDFDTDWSCTPPHTLCAYIVKLVVLARARNMSIYRMIENAVKFLYTPVGTFGSCSPCMHEVTDSNPTGRSQKFLRCKFS